MPFGIEFIVGTMTAVRLLPVDPNLTIWNALLELVATLLPMSLIADVATQVIVLPDCVTCSTEIHVFWYVASSQMVVLIARLGSNP